MKAFLLSIGHGSAKPLDVPVQNHAGAVRALRQTFVSMTPDVAAAVATLAFAGGVVCVLGATISGRTVDGAGAKCPHCGWLTPLRRVITEEELSEYLRQDGGFPDPRVIGAWQLGRPIYFKVATCEMCEESIGKNVVVYPEAST